MKKLFGLKQTRILLAVLCTFVMWNLVIASTQASNNKVIRVGYVENYGIYKETATGKMSGYSYEYLMEIAKYTGWEYEFVPVEWSEGIEQLKEGTLDLFGPMQKTKEREQEIAFPKQELGYEYGALYVSENRKDIYYHDLEAINKMKIATEPNMFYKTDLDNFCVQNEIEIEYVDTEASLFEVGLEQGAYDAVLAGSLLNISNAVVIDKIAVEPYYYATTIGNDKILEEMDIAVNEIIMQDAFFAVNLEKKYYGNQAIHEEAFTKEEAEFIKNHKTLSVAFDPTWAPLEYYDEKEDLFKGINKDIMNEISKICGIEFIPLEVSSYEESKQMAREAKVDLLMGYTQSQNNDLKVQYTTPFFEIPVIIITRKNFDFNKNLTVAMRKLGSALSKEIMNSYPNFTYLEYEKTKDVMEALKKNDAQAAFISTYSYDEIARTNAIEEYLAIPTEITFPQCIGVSESMDPILIDILNKSIHRLKEEQTSTIIFANTVGRAYSMPLAKILQENALLISLFLCTVFLGIVFMFLHNQKKLHKIAYIDSVTGTATLAKFQKDAKEILKHSKAGEHILVSLDLNNFKYINESFGYEVGNKILYAVSEFFCEHIYKGELVGRVGADRFVILAKENVRDQIEERLLDISKVEKYVEKILPGHYAITFCIGIYRITDGKENFSTMFDKANLARKSIKGLYEETLAEYTEEMNEELIWKKEVTLSKELALQNEEFEVYLQPKYVLENATLIGAEALARWNHPVKGILAPIKFIPIFEQDGFVKKLDYFVFEQVCKLIKSWKDKGTQIITISVNLSRLHLYNPNLIADLLSMTSRYDVMPENIEIELTESIVFYNEKLLIEIMNQLKEKGFQISIDDFGSGYSSLNMLKDLPVDVLKLDKGFLAESNKENNGKIIIESVTNLAKKLCITTVAEGVETREQVEMLKEIGCDIAQGYYYARPMPMKEFEEIASTNCKQLLLN